MATPNTIQSSALATASQKVNNRAQSPSHGKRDKKRHVLSEKLAVLEDQMHRDRDRSYREELQKIQVDVNLVTRVDPYAARPLEDIHREYREISHASANGIERNTRSLLEMAGPSFQEWCQHVDDLVERRDFELTFQKAEYDKKILDYLNTKAHKVETAYRERKALQSTLQDRLLNAITSKKARLSKEKEALEISDSSALLLHPNQFSYTNPASPGGTHSKRTTRLRREMEEHPNYSESRKRKRNAGDDDGSPVPIRRALDTSNTTPLWQNDKIRVMRRETGPIYSIDKLFTDKELSMTYNQAAMAAYKHQLTRRRSNGKVISPDESEAGNGDMYEEEKDQDLVAPTMERQPSHQTRSTRGGQSTNHQNFYDDKILGVEGLANFEIAGNLDRMSAAEPKLPPLIYSQYSKQYVKADANTPTALSLDDCKDDLMVMNVFKQYQRVNGVGSNLDAPNGGRKLLEVIANRPGHGKFASYVQGPRPSVERLAESLDLPLGSLQNEPVSETSALRGFAPGVAAVNNTSPAAPSMSRQSSFGGGVAMSRSGSGRGKRRG